jgi:hypothetical protein
MYGSIDVVQNDEIEPNHLLDGGMISEQRIKHLAK